VIKEMKNCLSRLSALETTQSFYDSVMTIPALGFSLDKSGGQKSN